MDLNNETLCIEAEEFMSDGRYNIVRICQLALGILFTVVLARLCWFCRKNRPKNLHKNLMILLVALLALYVLYVWSYILIAYIIMFTSHDSAPCACLTPLWLVYTLLMPFYAYLFASPLLHCAVMAERVLATFRVKKYEQQLGRKFGIVCICAIALLTALFCLYIFLSTFLDVNQTPYIMVYMSLASKFNSGAVFMVHYFLMAILVCIPIGDYWLIRKNQKMRQQKNTKNSAIYSLSQSYQMRENLLTMAIIFPLDFSYTIFFSIFLTLSVYFRSAKEQIGIFAFKINYESCSLSIVPHWPFCGQSSQHGPYDKLLLLHAVITLITYHYFLKKRLETNKNATVQPMDRMNLHFRTLQAQWKMHEMTRL